MSRYDSFGVVSVRTGQPTTVGGWGAPGSRGDRVHKGPETVVDVQDGRTSKNKDSREGRKIRDLLRVSTRGRVLGPQTGNVETPGLP